jgi:CRP-like cAMP-binding protein
VYGERSIQLSTSGLRRLQRPPAVSRFPELNERGIAIPTASKARPQNLLLAALPEKVYRRMLGKLETVRLTLGEILCEPWAETSHVYFPNDSLVSLVAVAAGGKALEVGMVGYQGMFGVSLALGVSKSPARALVQGAGTAMRMSARTFRMELKRNRWLHQEASRSASAAMATAMQVAACNNAHLLNARLARWLLMTSDCLAMSSFFLTQGFLAQMLGVRRTGVSEAAAALQKRGLVAYKRGKMTILNRPALVAASCGCYETIRKLTDR